MIQVHVVIGKRRRSYGSFDEALSGARRQFLAVRLTVQLLKFCKYIFCVD